MPHIPTDQVTQNIEQMNDLHLLVVTGRLSVPQANAIWVRLCFAQSHRPTNDKHFTWQADDVVGLETEG